MAGLPTGLIMLLFTDIEGSTRLWDQEPEAMAVALRRHDELVRAMVEARGGMVFKTVGDAFCVAFAAPKAALTAAVDTQRALSAEPWPTSRPIKVRMGLHAGLCEERDGDYFGPTVNRVARVEAAAHGGQILCSAAAADRLADLPLGVTLRALGTHQLADLLEHEALFQVEAAGLGVEFPPLRVRRVVSFTNNLPDDRSPFIGRAAEASEVVARLETSRVVTLTGTGGVGKTRLALEVARVFVERMGEGVWFIELADAPDSASVPGIVLSRLGIAACPADVELPTLVDVLRDQQRLIVLDNCEHVLDGAASIVNALAIGCPNLLVLVTSREPLRIAPESVYRVPPMTLPPDRVERLSDLAASEAVDIFIDRVRSREPAFTLTEDEAAPLASLCRRLDGIPLALELAAARVPAMSVTQLNERINRRFSLLTWGDRSALPRHRTLTGMIEWSVDLLNDAERAVFFALCVFPGSFDLEAAEAVCTDDEGGNSDVIDITTSLVDKSLVTVAAHGSTPRYSLLETLREFGRSSADAAERPREPLDAVRGRHARHFASLASTLNEMSLRDQAGSWHERSLVEKENFCAAAESLASGAQPDDAAAALRLFGHIGPLVDLSRERAQVLSVLDRCLAAGRSIDRAAAGAALFCKAILLQFRAWDEMLDCLTESAEIAEEMGDLPTLIRALGVRAFAQQDEESVAEAVEAARWLGHRGLLAATLNRYGAVLLNTGPDRATAPLEEALGLAEAVGDVRLQAHIRLHLSAIAILHDELDVAREHLDRIVALSDRLASFDTIIISAFVNIGWLKLAEGVPESAEPWLLDGFWRAKTTGMKELVRDTTLALACCANARGDAARAAILHGAADAAAGPIGKYYDSYELRMRDSGQAEVRAALGQAFDALYQQGRRLGADAVTAQPASTSDHRGRSHV